MNRGTTIYAAEGAFRAWARTHGDRAVAKLDWYAATDFVHHAAIRGGYNGLIRVEDIPSMSAPVDGTATASIDRSGVGLVRLSKRGQEPLTIIHEVAHLLAPVPPEALHRAHGPYWLVRYLELTRDMLGARTAGQLALAMQRHRVRGVSRPLAERGQFDAIVG